MQRLIVRYLISTTTPKSLIALGQLLIRAGEAAQAKYAAIEQALAAVRQGVNVLTEK